MGMDQYLLIPFLGEWTSIYQLFWCSLGTRVLTHCHLYIPVPKPSTYSGLPIGWPACPRHSNCSPRSVAHSPSSSAMLQRSPSWQVHHGPPMGVVAVGNHEVLRFYLSETMVCVGKLWGTAIVPSFLGGLEWEPYWPTWEVVLSRCRKSPEKVWAHGPSGAHRDRGNGLHICPRSIFSQVPPYLGSIQVFAAYMLMMVGCCLYSFLFWPYI